ncbi:S41 family peptidase [Thermoflexus sp.]|uniref:S41 family peptidase n=1 Tax=Thermoflexus sp. TaxID=1969742 RepID=UPI0025CBBEDC|nr:S41 family peptidase [Thermoflexus sp.]MDW8179796.1 S41 family peptidase [Anaerolineae bacterium]MCS6964826.1 S41 family peptidase [Thermoflexus sp.]MCS7350345.1 S41 family peptidase [Thermoflexus sp.]MCX7689810.1 S41 family peptidase [Thermoflexus sp.]MDW8183702.1 S41 family peptidase [Anaerolineae bacterium]
MNSLLRRAGNLLLFAILATGLIGSAFLSGFAVAWGMSAGSPRTPHAAPAVSTPAPPPQDLQQAFKIFWEAWKLVQDEYYGEIPAPQTVAYGAIRGALQTLGDPYTSFIEPKIARILQEDASGQFEGIGALVRMNRDNKLEIVRTFEGSPAQKAGLRAGDLVVKVNGQSIVGYSIYEAIALIRGPAGTSVTLTIERPGQRDPLEVTVTRARITIPIVETRMLPENIAYVQLFDFSAQATRQLREQLKALLAQNPRGLILDLRDNPGGFLDQAIQVADLFLSEGVVAYERMKDGEERVFRSKSGDIAEKIPMVVLVNAGSASASEIVAGALQDRGRARLVGERTFGKGSVQLSHTLSDGSELRVTIARWFTPNNRAIHGEGLNPDVEVKVEPGPETGGADPQLQRAIEVLLQGP